MLQKAGCQPVAEGKMGNADIQLAEMVTHAYGCGGCCLFVIGMSDWPAAQQLCAVVATIDLVEQSCGRLLHEKMLPSCTGRFVSVNVHPSGLPAFGTRTPCSALPHNGSASARLVWSCASISRLYYDNLFGAEHPQHQTQ
jgi:hypothetical protein